MRVLFLVALLFSPSALALPCAHPQFIFLTCENAKCEWRGSVLHQLSGWGCGLEPTEFSLVRDELSISTVAFLNEIHVVPLEAGFYIARVPFLCRGGFYKDIPNDQLIATCKLHTQFTRYASLASAQWLWGLKIWWTKLKWFLFFAGFIGIIEMFYRWGWRKGFVPSAAISAVVIIWAVMDVMTPDTINVWPHVYSLFAIANLGRWWIRYFRRSRSSSPR